MKKSDLRTGMIVKVRNGSEFMVLLNACHEYTFSPCTNFLVSVLRQSWEDLDAYTNDLKFPNENDYDIIEVFIVDHLNRLWNHSFEKTSIWKREEEQVELTLEEIAEKFGIDVDKLKIKK